MEIFLNGISRRRLTGMGTTLKSHLVSDMSWSESSARWVLHRDRWRCNLVKEESWEIRVFHDLQTHLNCIRVLTGSRDRISVMSSSKRTDVRTPPFDCRESITREWQQLCYECMMSVTMKKAVTLMLKLETLTNICLFLSHY